MPIKPKKIAENTAKNARLLSKSLDNSIIDSQKLLKSAIRELEKNIITTMHDLETGKRRGVLGSSTGLRQAQYTHGKLVQYFEEYYGKGARRAVKGYNAVAANIKRYWTGKRKIKFTELDRDLMHALANQSLDEFIQFGDFARERIAKSMYLHIISGSPFGELVDELRGVLGMGKDARGNNMSRYAELWANDGVMNFNQAVTLKKAADMGIKRFLYAGGIIKTTRDFCRVRSGRIYTKREINSWNTMTWSGKRGPAFIYRGGWNCRHWWVPIENDQFEE